MKRRRVMFWVFDKYRMSESKIFQERENLKRDHLDLRNRQKDKIERMRKMFDRKNSCLEDKNLEERSRKIDMDQCMDGSMDESMLWIAIWIDVWIAFWIDVWIAIWIDVQIAIWVDL